MFILVSFILHISSHHYDLQVLLCLWTAFILGKNLLADILISWGVLTHIFLFFCGIHLATLFINFFIVLYICIIIMSVQVTVLSCICIDKQADKYVFCSKVIQNQTILVTHCWKYSGCTVLSSNVRMTVQGHLITSPHCHKQWIFTSAVSTCMPWLTIACTASPNVWVVTSGLSYQTLQSLLHFIWDVCYMQVRGPLSFPCCSSHSCYMSCITKFQQTFCSMYLIRYQTCIDCRWHFMVLYL